VVGLGMNRFELAKNKQLSDYVTQDLNINPIFPFPDDSFDFVTCVVSVDYLTRPLEVFSEIRRVLKQGGTAIISQSNRCFPTKAINIWLNTNDIEHVFIIGAYFHYATGFTPPNAVDISPKKGFSDPMYIISASKA
jgi:SAM-dependent methyltransferase